MPNIYSVTPAQNPVSGTIQPPGSKSLTNRALVTAALAHGRSILSGVLESRDTEVMIDSLSRLGISIRRSGPDELEIDGCGGHIPAGSAELWLENSGTSIRFLTAMCTLGQGTYRLDGNSRMRERPIGDLVTALQGLGSKLQYVENDGYPPVEVFADGLQGGKTTVAGNISSQFLSALLMAAPCAMQDVEILVQGELVSQPYVRMTLQVMAQFGVEVPWDATGRFPIRRQSYRGHSYQIEPDASAASYFFAAAAVTGGEITVPGLSRQALQGDVRFVEVLEQMGCRVQWGPDSVTVQGDRLRGIDVDMNDISDTAQTLAAVAPFAEGPTRIRNVAHMRHKETDRVEAVVTELRRLGLQVDEFPDGMIIHPGDLRPAVIETYDDHRMAMSFALIGLRVPGIQISDPGCTSKTYPGFFQDLERLCK